MQPSPYTPGEVAPEVPGRAAQLADFEERLSYLVDLHRLVGRIRVDHAPRGLGKTSLLSQYQRRAGERGALTIWVTAGGRPLVAQLADAILRETATWRSAARRAIAEQVASLDVAVGVPGVARVTAHVRQPPPEPFDARGLESLVRTAAGEAPAVILFIDELQEADREGIRTVAYAWQHLQSEGQDVPAAVFAAGLPNTPDVVSAAATLSERFAFRAVEPLDRDAAEVALLAPARRLGVTWEPEAADVALEFAQGNPYVLQLLGDAVWTELGRPDPGAVVSVAAVRAGQRRMRADLEALYRARLAQSAPGERRFMIAMAQAGDGPVARADIAARLGVAPRALSVPRARLIDKGFVRAAARGELEFTMPGFARYLRGLEE